MQIATFLPAKSEYRDFWAQPGKSPECQASDEGP